MTGGGTPARVLDLGLDRGSEHGPEEKRVSCVGMWILGEPRADFYWALVLRKCFVGEFNLAQRFSEGRCCCYSYSKQAEAGN